MPTGSTSASPLDRVAAALENAGDGLAVDLASCLVDHLRAGVSTGEGAVYGLALSGLLLWAGVMANSETPDLFSFTLLFAIGAVWKSLATGQQGLSTRLPAAA